MLVPRTQCLGVAPPTKTLTHPARMIVLLSPAKTLDFSPADVADVTQPRLLEQTAQLAATLRKKSPKKLQELMSISSQLAEQNAARFQAFDEPDSLASAKPALLAFRGDVYRGLDVDTFEPGDLAYAQDHVRVLSGMYGLLRPTDLIQPYRLEMGTQLKVGRKKNLYEFWGDRITELLRADIESTGAQFVLNAASKEYMGSVDTAKLGVPVIEADFRERRGGKLKFITFNAKVARGKLAQLVVRERIESLAGFVDLDVNGYAYDEARSTAQVVAFTKECD